VNVNASEALGTVRADLRRVETTLGARFEARVAMSEALVRDEIQREIRTLREEVAQFREETAERLRLLCEDLRRHLEGAPAIGPRDDIRLIAEGLLALDAKVEALHDRASLR
jgi:hypothetical protein